jgi:hypothetical protein
MAEGEEEAKRRALLRGKGYDHLIKSLSRFSANLIIAMKALARTLQVSSCGLEIAAHPFLPL